MQYSKIIDISLPLNEKTSLYPGNPPVAFEHFGSSSGTSFNSKIVTSLHNGTHVDAPAHAFSDGKGIDALNLNLFIGQSRVLDFTACKTEITVDDLQSKQIQEKERILFKTSNSIRGFDTFYEDYVYLSSQGAVYLAELGVSFVGIDAWSIKKKGSKDNTSHTALLSKGIPVLEGITLIDAEEGEYFLIATPLKLQHDASPVRAVLLET